MITLSLLVRVGCAASPADTAPTDTAARDTATPAPDTGTPADTAPDSWDSTADSADTGGPPVCSECWNERSTDPRLRGEIGTTRNRLFYYDGGLGIPASGLETDPLFIPDAIMPARLDDVDGDGLSDFLVLAWGAAEVEVISGTGAELYSTAFEDFRGLPSGAGAGSGAVLLCYEGFADVFAPDDLTFSASLNTIQAGTWVSDSTTAPVYELDVTGDGVEDHVLFTTWYPDDYGWGKVWIVDGTDRGTTNAETDAFATLAGADEAYGGLQQRVTSKDVNSDGTPDLILQDRGLSVYDVSAGGTIDPAATLLHVTDVVDGHVLDFDGDGTLDLVGVTDGDPPVGFEAILGLGTGNLTFTDAINWRYPLSEWNRLEVLDIDDDGIDDVVYQGSGGPSWLFLGGPIRVPE